MLVIQCILFLRLSCSTASQLSSKFLAAHITFLRGASDAGAVMRGRFGTATSFRRPRASGFDRRVRVKHVLSALLTDLTPVILQILSLTTS